MEINDLIKLIQKYINSVEDIKVKQVGNIVLGIVNFGFNLTGAILTGGIAAPILFSSAATLNIFTTILSE